MNSTSLQDASGKRLDRLRRIVEAGEWHPDCFYSGATSGRLPNPNGSVFNTRQNRTRFRYVCLLTGVVAFVLGFLAGTIIPALLVANKNLTQNVSIVALQPEEIENRTRYDRVTFVEETPPARVSKAVTVNLGKNFEDNEIESSGKNSVVNGVYWGDIVEAALPDGFSEKDALTWKEYTRNVSVVQIKEGCGRMQNRLLKFSDGTISCCRYRRNTDQIQGELFSFYLGQALGLKNLVPTSLGLVKMRDSRWSSVASEMTLAQWVEDKPVVLTKFIPHLRTAFIPFNFRNSSRRLHPTDITYNSTTNSTNENLTDLVELAQWSDMIIFDYLTANLDRVVNNLYNLQWNFAMMDAPTHNLQRTSTDRLLIFLDNESGLLHGYRLLDKYEPYHSTLLDSLCMFRKPTAERIKQLKRDGNIGEILQDIFNKYEPEFKDYLPSLPDKSINILNDRISRVFDVIEKCESMFSGSRSR